MVLPEVLVAGIYNSQVAAKNVTVSKNRKTSMFEIELSLEQGGVSYIDSISFPITPNTLICAKPGQTRHTKFPFKCYYIHLIIHEGPLYETLMNLPDFFEVDKRETCERLFERLVRHYNTPSENEEIILQGLFLELVYEITKNATKRAKSKGTATNNMTEKALAYIKEHLTEDLSLETVAKTMSLSPIHFHNTFKTAVGKTLREYVEEQRIKKATQLLITTNATLTEIAFECGFSSQSYFSYAFKRRMNMTPREYVREIYNKYEM